MTVPETRQVRGDGSPATGSADGGLGGAELLAWGRLCVAALEQRRAEIDALNVFPVPDSDTGTNLLATMRAAVAEAQRSASGADGEPDRPPAGVVAAALARGATAGARGNSGIIVSQVLRGFADATVDAGLTEPTYRTALARAAALVRGSLSDPVEGTILTVLDRAGAAAQHCAEPGLAAVVRAGADAAARALEDTRDQLAVLRDAGVVDAGARGLLVLLDGLVTVVTGETPARAEYRPADIRTPPARPESAQRYEVMYRIDGGRADLAGALRSRLAALGDSVVVAADGTGGWSVHVHCADAGAAVEAGLAVGRPVAIRIEHLTEIPARGGITGHSGPHSGGAVVTGVRAAADSRQAHDRAARQISGRIGEPADRGVLAVASGAGAAALFEAGGAVVLNAGQTLDSAVLLAAVRQLPHREVLVLPNGALPAHGLVAVGAAARDARRDVLLLPSASMVQGLAALAVHDRARIAVDDAFTMSEAAASTRWGALRRAAGRALTMVGTCAPGDGLGLVGHDVVVIDRDPRAAGQTLLDRMLGLGGELVTLLVGAAAPDGLADDLARHIGDEFPGVEVTVYAGGQQGDLIQIGVE
ncbi:DAK2 domain-containing protein [Nocardia sp. NPDC004568]|uniref:DAK2 domain-containing protein n=1 Tax=Nocardia sp. NPDC004568 TaxID=3154551 RepID=UPI0033ABD6E8